MVAESIFAGEIVDRLLSFEDFVSVDSIDALADIYARKRRTFSGEKDFLTTVRVEWSQLLRTLTEEASTKCVPQKIPHLEVTVRRRYNIYGVPDGIYSSKTTQKLLESSIVDQNMLISTVYGRCPFYMQQEKRVVNPGDPFSGRNWASLFVSSLVLSTVPPLLPIMTAYGLHRQKSEANVSEIIQYNLPPEAVGDVPAYISLRLRERDRKPEYTFSQRESAYIAEFARASGKDVGIIVKREKVPEIKYFLVNGVKDHKVVDTAHHKVELLWQDSEQYAQRHSREEFGKSMAIVAGFCVGTAFLVLNTYALLSQ